MKSRLLSPLLLLLGALLAVVWMIDRRSPAYPNGQTPSLLLFAALAVGLTWAAVIIVRR